MSCYNLLPMIARKMGLETKSDRGLWKDRAIVELNSCGCSLAPQIRSRI
jgi:nitric oxide synthase oxygenase domain/subunit